MGRGRGLVIAGLWLSTAAAAFWLGRYSASVPPPATEPTAPRLLTVKDEWAGSELRRTVRNKGATGEVLFLIHQGNRSWAFRTGFDAGEERQLRFDLSGILLDQPSTIEWLPVAQASKSELQNAVIPK